MATETQTPIETLKRAQIYNCRSADPEHCKLPICTDARAALEDVEALVKAARGITALFINHRGGCWDVVTIRENSDHHHNLRDALAKFQVES